MTETVATPAPEPAVDELARHASKMAKKKAARDKIMAGKEGEKGLIIVHTGAGKGKSSSGFGMILRCVAHGMPSAVVQFIKGAWDTGERRLITTHFSDLCQFHAMGEGFTWETQDKERDARAARPGDAGHGHRQLHRRVRERAAGHGQRHFLADRAVGGKGGGADAPHRLFRRVRVGEEAPVAARG